MPKSTPKIDDARVFALADQGLSQRQIAEKLNVSHVAIGNRLRSRSPAGQPAVPAAPAPPLRGRLAAVASMLTEVGGFPEHVATIFEAISQLDAAPATAEPLEIEPDEPDEPDEPTDHLTRCRSLYARSLKLASSAERLGNVTAAQRAMRDSAALATLIARIEKTTRDDQDVFRVSQSEISDAQQSFLTKLRMLCDRGPMRCAKCNRELSIEYADLDPMPADSEATNA